MSKKTSSKREYRSYPVGERFYNDQLSRGLNKALGLPEDFEGSLVGLEETLPLAVRVFNSDSVKEVPKNEKSYTL